MEAASGVAGNYVTLSAKAVGQSVRLLLAFVEDMCCAEEDQTVVNSDPDEYGTVTDPAGAFEVMYVEPCFHDHRLASDIDL